MAQACQPAAMLAVEDVNRDSRLLANYQLNLAAKDDEVSANLVVVCLLILCFYSSNHSKPLPCGTYVKVSLSPFPHLLSTVHLGVVSTFQCDSGLGAYKLYELIYEEKDQKVV